MLLLFGTPETAQLIISGIAGIASVISAWRDARELKRELTDEEIEKAVSSSSSTSSIENNISTMSPSTSAQVIAQVIPATLADVMRNNIESHSLRLKTALEDRASTPQEKDREIEIASAAICKELNRIRRLNKGTLPPDLQSYAESFRCQI